MKHSVTRLTERYKQQEAMKTVTSMKPDELRKMLRGMNLPGWMTTPDIERTSWINGIIGALDWPVDRGSRTVGKFFGSGLLTATSCHSFGPRTWTAPPEISGGSRLAMAQDPTASVHLYRFSARSRTYMRRMHVYRRHSHHDGPRRILSNSPALGRGTHVLVRP